MKPILTGDVEELQQISLLERAFQPFKKYLIIGIVGAVLGFALTVVGLILMFRFDGWELAFIFAGVLIINASALIASRYTQPRKAYRQVQQRLESKDHEWLLAHAYYGRHTKLYDNAKMLFSLYACIDLTLPEVAPILVDHYREFQDDPKIQLSYTEPLHVLARKLGYDAYPDLLKDY